MTLSDKMAMRQVIGCLMLNPLLFLEYTDISPIDFDDRAIGACFITIKNLYEEGAQKLTPVEVDLEIEKRGGALSVAYKNGNGIDILNTSYEFAELSNFKLYYTRLKKYSLLRRLQKDKYDISEFYISDKDLVNPLDEVEIQRHFDESSLEDILNAVESKYTIIRNEFLGGGKKKGDPAEGIMTLIDDLKKAPSVGPSLEGDIFSTACRGAREGCFYLKAASTSAGKTRTSVFDACHMAYPIRWSHEQGSFCYEVDKDGVVRNPRKVLFIVTEMDKEELQTIMLAYLSGVDEDHILTGRYEGLGEEEERVRYAGKIMEQYSGYFLIEEISDPNLVNVEATIKKYVVTEDVKYVWFDYIHTTASMMMQFSRNNLREDSILMMFANQLKQIAKDYKVFIFSATQVNATAMAEDGEFKNETCIRGAKSIADKADMGYVMTRVSDKFWNNLIPTLRTAAAAGKLSYDVIDKRPTHVLDIYKMRRGRYKNVRIWTKLHLGTGYREDLFITTSDNQPIQDMSMDLFKSATQVPIDWRQELRA